jgi:hypothetical protein
MWQDAFTKIVDNKVVKTSLFFVNILNLLYRFSVDFRSTSADDIVIDDNVTVCSVTLIETLEVRTVICSDDLTLSEN